MPQPNKIPKAFAASGDRNIIPESTGDLGLASWNEGFPAICSVPFSEGGLAPKRADFNGVFNALSQATRWQQQGGIYAYDNATDYEVGNIVVYNNDIYLCRVANGPGGAVKSPTDTETWSRLFTSAGGTMSGAVTHSNTVVIKKTVDNAEIQILGSSSYSNGAALILFGKDNSSNPGRFHLRTGDGSGTAPYLSGSASGSLEWGGQSLEIVDAKSIGQSGYIKYKSGLMMCWGTFSIPSAAPADGKEVTFPTAFTAEPMIALTTRFASVGSAITSFKVYPRSNTGFTAYLRVWNGSTLLWDYGNCGYIAVGYYSA